MVNCCQLLALEKKTNLFIKEGEEQAFGKSGKEEKAD